MYDKRSFLWMETHIFPVAAFVAQVPAEVAQRLRRRRKGFRQGLAVRDEAHVRRVVEKFEVHPP